MVKTANRRWAVLIGINGYHESLGPLRYSVSDCRRLHQVLTTGEDPFDVEQVLVLADDEPPNRQPTFANIHSWLASWLAQPGESDTVLVFFAGHGREMDGNCYLVPADATLQTLHVTGIPVPYVRELLTRCKARQKLLILDACHSGAGRDVSTMTAPMLQSLSLGKGIYTLTSCDAGESSHEWDEKEQGVFSYYLSEALGGACEPDATGRLTADRIYEWVYERVRQWAAMHRCSQSPKCLANANGPIEIRRGTPNWEQLARSQAAELEKLQARVAQLQEELDQAREREQLLADVRESVRKRLAAHGVPNTKRAKRQLLHELVPSSKSGLATEEELLAIVDAEAARPATTAVSREHTKASTAVLLSWISVAAAAALCISGYLSGVGLLPLPALPVAVAGVAGLIVSVLALIASSRRRSGLAPLARLEELVKLQARVAQLQGKLDQARERKQLLADVRKSVRQRFAVHGVPNTKRAKRQLLHELVPSSKSGLATQEELLTIVDAEAARSATTGVSREHTKALTAVVLSWISAAAAATLCISGYLSGVGLLPLLALPFAVAALAGLLVRWAGPRRSLPFLALWCGLLALNILTLRINPHPIAMAIPVIGDMLQSTNAARLGAIEELVRARAWQEAKSEAERLEHLLRSVPGPLASETRAAVTQLLIKDILPAYYALQIKHVADDYAQGRLKEAFTRGNSLLDELYEHDDPSLSATRQQFKELMEREIRPKYYQTVRVWCEDGGVMAWDQAVGVVRELGLFGHHPTVCLSPDGTRVAILDDQDRNLFVVNVDGTCLSCVFRSGSGFLLDGWKNNDSLAIAVGQRQDVIQINEFNSRAKD